MKIVELVSILEAHFGQPAAAVASEQVRFALVEGDWVVALCAGRGTALEHLATFERALQLLLEAREAEAPRVRLGLAVDVAAIERGEQPSYRKALKKYSSSIVFEDVGVALFLIAPGKLKFLEPSQINSFLRDLDIKLRKH